MKTPRPRLAGELVFCGLLLLFAAFLLWSSYGISGLASYTSAGSFPMAASALMVICGLVIVRQTARAPRAHGGTGETVLRQFLRQITPGVVIAFSVAIGLYMAALEPLGFIVSSYLFMVACMWLLGSRKPLTIAIVSAACLGAIYVVFQTAFSVVLPAGTLWQGVFQ